MEIGFCLIYEWDNGRLWSWRVVKKGIMGDGIDMPWCFVLGALCLVLCAW